ncbi:MAG: sigma-70 family RNA polymerase sigma factor [Clostridia bacterium]|nr:sigma-70 family RNA polymerase sigma factor [Clostridia bacterium]
MIFNENTELKGIILGCREHDDSAFAELVRRYTPLVKRMISDFDGEYAEDELFSEACVALHRAAMSFDLEQGEVSFGLYARVCVYHHFVDLKRCRNKISVIGDYNIDIAAFDEGPDMRLFEREHLEGVIRYAKSALSDYEYSVLIYHMHGYKTAQIAERLGKTSKSVDNAKARVFRRLREASKDIP